VIEDLITRPNGILLVTGPTGAGKTTTLYACLNKINSPELNIMTVEDPVEYELRGISQMPVQPKIGLTFAAGLRSFLRQDPDVIMVGEIRDHETAEIAIHASLTGHLVFSTLHTNDAAGAFARMVEMGVQPFLIASSLLGVLAQRLVRKLCMHCRRRDDAGRWHPVGCEHCAQTGYKGRTGVYELMTVDDKLRSLIHSRSAESQIFVAAEANGLRPMREDGQRLVDEGITSLEEVLRVTRE
jgi:general secretion pathway protein E